MLILILIDVQYLQKAVFSSEKGSNGQNYSSSGPQHLIKKSSQPKFLTPPLLLNAICKTLMHGNHAPLYGTPAE